MNTQKITMKMTLFALFASFSACMSMHTGKKVDATNLAKIVEDQTTETQLIALLGSPTMENEGMVLGGWRASCGKKGDSIRTLMYTHAVGKNTGLFSSNTQANTLMFYINKRGVVCKKQNQSMNINSGF